MSDSDGGVVAIIAVILFFYFVVDFLTGIEDDVVYPETVIRAEERCARNDGLKYLEQSGGVAAVTHDVYCNDGARFSIPREASESNE